MRHIRRRDPAAIPSVTDPGQQIGLAAGDQDPVTRLALTALLRLQQPTEARLTGVDAHRIGGIFALQIEGGDHGFCLPKPTMGGDSDPIVPECPSIAGASANPKKSPRTPARRSLATMRARATALISRAARAVGSKTFSLLFPHQSLRARPFCGKQKSYFQRTLIPSGYNTCRRATARSP